MCHGEVDNMRTFYTLLFFHILGCTVCLIAAIMGVTTYLDSGKYVQFIPLSFALFFVVYNFFLIKRIYKSEKRIQELKDYVTNPLEVQTTSTLFDYCPECGCIDYHGQPNGLNMCKGCGTIFPPEMKGCRYDGI